MLGGGVIIFIFGWYLFVEGEWVEFLFNFMVNGIFWVFIGIGSGMLVEWLDIKIFWLEVFVKRVVVSLVLMVFYLFVVAMLVFFFYVGLVYGIVFL